MGFAFVQISDHHLRASEALLTYGYSPAWAFRAVLRHIAENVADQIDFIVTTGDLVHAGTDEEYQTVRQMMQFQPVSAAPGPQRITFEGLTDFPFYCLPGNHDPRQAFYRNLFPLSTAAEQMNVAFEHQGVQFVCLDWGADNKAVATTEMLEFLKGALQAPIPTILFMHHHVVPIGSRWLDDFIADDVQKFWDLVAGVDTHRQKVLGVFCGHTHASYETQVAGVPVFGVRSTTFQFALQDERLFCLRPPHYRLVTIEDGSHGVHLETKIFEVPL
ncbi:MAG: hypothetical protein EXR62_01570 [Chloroflexi bacterium]|nr:hypothetical protein [Chloroflexota bacterium]